MVVLGMFLSALLESRCSSGRVRGRATVFPLSVIMAEPRRDAAAGPHLCSTVHTGCLSLVSPERENLNFETAFINKKQTYMTLRDHLSQYAK